MDTKQGYHEYWYTLTMKYKTRPLSETLTSLSGSAPTVYIGVVCSTHLPNMVFGCAMKMVGSTTKRVLSTMSVTLSDVLMVRAPTAVVPAAPSLALS